MGSVINRPENGAALEYFFLTEDELIARAQYLNEGTHKLRDYKQTIKSKKYTVAITKKVLSYINKFSKGGIKGWKYSFQVNLPEATPTGHIAFGHT